MEVDGTELLYTALRASFVYLFLLLIVRLLGKPVQKKDKRVRR